MSQVDAPAAVVQDSTNENKQENKPADAVQAPETGGGESLTLADTATQEDSQVAKIADQAKSNDENQIKVENVISADPEESKKELTQESTEISIKTEPGANNGKSDSNEVSKGSGEWQQRELELLKKIAELEKVTSERSEDGLRLELKVREEEIDLLKARVKNLETELQAALSKPSGKNHEMIEKIKLQHEELLSKARGMIFDKTKMVKNQELQIQALTTQVASLKDINIITKDLLDIRNSEVKAMEERFQAMDARYKAEKERYSLVLQRAQTSTNINDDLRKEYETQLAIFKELREKYEERVQALVAENNRLKESIKGTTSG
ncbi:unnamed protein product [Parnassius apollo]|uniref:(apollo) hypothetical protein n=1 Tax=Parnassius apollo TaxID=110799 RepID=A0A8S3WX51_PARAO|nr:unnamed protein product [Parnassius apollo]